MLNKGNDGNSSPLSLSNPPPPNPLLTNSNPMKGRIKRQTGLFSAWKQRSFKIRYTPQQQLTLTIEKNSKEEEHIDLLQSKLSKKCSFIEKNPCFGIVIATGKKYLVGLINETDTKELHAAIIEERKNWRIMSSGLMEEELSMQSIEQENESSEKKEMKEEEMESSGKKQSTYAYSPSKEEDLSEDYHPRKGSEDIGQEQKDDIFCTVMSEEPINRPIQFPLTQMQPLSSVEQEYLQCDSGFKLHMNFPEGRLLCKNLEAIKCNLLLTCMGSAEEIMSGFFNLQLWNEKVKEFKVLNRISGGLFLVYLELNRCNLLSLPRYCYLAVSAYRTDGETLLTMRTMNRQHFDKPMGKTWVDCCLLVRVKTTPIAPSQKLLTAVLILSQPNNFQSCLTFISQLKIFQSLLRTSASMPPFPLEWLALS